MFWSHPDGLKLLRTYPNVFCIDATYGTNTYNYALVEIIGVAPTNQNFIAAQVLLQHENKASYLWAMRCFAELFGEGVYPKAIVTDRELGLIKPIEMVFPYSRHVLCMFHVKKMIRTRATNIMNNQEEADALCYGAVRKMLEAPTVKEFEQNEGLLRSKYRWLPSFLKYLDETWLPHKEKIVFAWTNDVMHYGNNTTNRVESAHSSMKSWMKSSRGGLETLFEVVHAEIEGQVTEIKCKLEWSRSKNLLGFNFSPYMLLLRRASHYCLTLLEKEQKKPGICTHAMLTTHGLPCQCQIENLINNGGFIFPESIDPFWTTLAFDGEEIEVPPCPYDLSRMVEDFNERDPADQLHMSQIFHAHMYPEECAYEEPGVNVTKKGRPNKKKGKTNRQLSHWEHVEKKYATNPSTQTTSNVTNDAKPKIKGSRDVPPFLREYLVSVDNVEGDGNCGFRCAALRFFGSEDMYVTVRQLMVAEINSHREVYQLIYNGYNAVDDAIHRINWTGRRCTSEYWMQINCDLFVMAQVFRTVVSLYSCDQDGKIGCTTVLPWRGEISEYQQLPEISIIFRTHKLHFVLGHFGSGNGSIPDHPLPTLHPQWCGLCNKSLRHWEDQYGDRLGRYLELESLFTNYSKNRVRQKKKKIKTISIN